MIIKYLVMLIGALANATVKPLHKKYFEKLPDAPKSATTTSIPKSEIK